MRFRQTTEWIAIPLSRGILAKVDAADAELVTQWKWSANETEPGRFYAQRRESDGSNVYLHRFLAGARAGELVDHENGDTLDCRRSNLRVATHRQNSVNANRRQPSLAGYRGVRLRESGRYDARVKVDRKHIVIGRFDTDIEAAKAYDRAARHYHGEFAVLNFPEMSE